MSNTFLKCTSNNRLVIVTGPKDQDVFRRRVLEIFERTNAPYTISEITEEEYEEALLFLIESNDDYANKRVHPIH